MNTEKFWKDNEIMAGVSEKLNNMTNLEIESKSSYPVQEGSKDCSRRVVDFDGLKSNYYVKQMKELLAKGDLQEYAVKLSL